MLQKLKERQKTVKQCEYVFGNFQDFFEADPFIKDIGQSIIRRFLKNLIYRGYSKSIVAINHRVLQTFFNWLLKKVFGDNYLPKTKPQNYYFEANLIFA